MIYSIGTYKETSVKLPRLNCSFDYYFSEKLDNAVFIPSIVDDQLVYLIMASLNQKKNVLLVNDVRTLLNIDYSDLQKSHYYSSADFIFINFSYRNRFFQLNQNSVISSFSQLSLK
jgi:hypothetical protein